LALSLSLSLAFAFARIDGLGHEADGAPRGLATDDSAGARRLDVAVGARADRVRAGVEIELPRARVTRRDRRAADDAHGGALDAHRHVVGADPLVLEHDAAGLTARRRGRR